MFFRNLKLYSLTQAIDLDAAALETALATKPHRAPAPQEFSTAGFVPPLGGETLALVHASSGALLVALRISHRDLKSTVVDKEVRAKVKAIEAEQLRKVYKKERDQIKDEVINAFLPRAFVVDKTVFAYIDTVAGRVVVDTASASAAENVLSTLREAIGSLPVRPTGVKIAPTATMTDWLKNQEAATDFYVLDNCELVDTDEAGGLVRCKRQDLTGDAVQLHLANGKLCRRLSLAYKDQLSFDLADDLTVARLRFEDLLQEKAEQDGGEDALSQLDASFTLMVLTLRQFIGDLLTVLGGEEIPQGIGGDSAPAPGRVVQATDSAEGVDVTRVLGLVGSGVTARLVIPEGSTSAEVGEAFSDTDPLLEEATAFVRSSRRASISALQRKLLIGYNRAARLIETLEARGVVTPMNSHGAREVIA